jgi:tetratricopeptide (TPR) repeat protein
MISVAEAGDFEAFIRCQDEVKSLATAIDQPTPIWMETLSRCARVLLAGDAAGAEAVAEVTLRLGRSSGQPDVETIYGIQQFLVRWHQGRSDELVEAMERLTAAVPQLASLRAGLLLVLIHAGLLNRARALLASERAAGFDRPYDYLWLPRVCALAEGAVELGDLDSARELYEHIGPWDDQVAYVLFGMLGAAAHYLGELATTLGRFQDAERHLASAQSIHERLDAPFHLARTHLAWARLLTSRDGSCAATTDEVSHRLALARDLAKRFGCAGVSRQVDELLGRARR